MRCPRCDGSVLDERERQGVVVDVCPSCRGVWLDRGELEKIIAKAKQDLEEERAHYEAPRYRARDSEPPSSDRRHGYPSQGKYPEHGDRHGHYRRKSWLENLGDLFD